MATSENKKRAARENGKRGGRPPGRLNAATLERKAVEDAVRQRILQRADRLLNSQFGLAQGLMYVYRIDETIDDKGKKIREHVLVTDPDEIKAVLDENQGGDGMVEDNYYYITTKDPNNIAIDSLFNRAIGKPTENVDVTSKGDKLQTALTPDLLKAVADFEKRMKNDVNITPS